MNIRPAFRRFAAFASLTLLASCGGDSGHDPDDVRDVSEEERYGGTVVIASILDLQSMNALTSAESDSRLVQREILFMPLLRYDEALEPRPWLAERWDTVRVAQDTLELTFRIRSDVLWHDGRPTTAEDVLFTYQRVVDPAVASPLATSFALYAPTAVLLDPHTLKLRLRAHAEFLDGWTELAIMPKHLLEDTAPDQLATHPFGTRNPVGNGPFRFVRRTPGQEWVFEANPDFPTALGGRPYLDRLAYRVIPDQTALLTETLTGAIDVNLAVSAAQASQIEASPQVELLSSPTTNWVFIAWNSRLPLFDSPEERRALSSAIDRQAIVDALLHGHAEVGRSTVPPTHWAYAGSEAGVSHDLQAARELLARAGWSDRNGDGIVQDELGRPFRFTLSTPQGSDITRDITQVVQAQLRRLGIDVRPSVVEANTLIGQIVGSLNGSGQRERSFDAVVMGWTDSFRKDDSNLFHSRNLNNPFQFVGYSNPRIDALLDTLGVILDREQARPLWHEYQIRLVEEAPKTVLYYPDRLTAVHKRVQGVVIDARGEFASVTRWWLDPARRRGAPASAPRPAPLPDAQ